MRIGFRGRLHDEPEIRVGHIGCGSHSFRNIFPTYQFAPVKLVATCDLDGERAAAFAAQFGAAASYTDYGQMLAQEELDAVFVVVGYDQRGRPLYPDVVIDCIQAGCHVWMEKPPAASCAEIERMQAAAAAQGVQVMVGLKKMFFPANEKAKALMADPAFGQATLAMLQYPQYVPTLEEFARYQGGEDQGSVRGFMDHLCHPASLMIYLLGMPDRLFYARSDGGGGLATLIYAPMAERGKVVATLALTHGASRNSGMERTTIVGSGGRHIVVDNCLTVTYQRTPPDEPNTGYGASPNFYTGTPEETSAVWQPEFSLGQLYNKGLFLLGYYNEVTEFARAILEGRPLRKAGLDHAWQVTRLYEAFAQGPEQIIDITKD